MTPAERIVAALPRDGGRPRLIPYLMAGFPRLDLTVELLLAAEAGGAALVELGLPHSDPLADGPTIQAAGQTALREGTTVARALAQLATARSRGLAVPVVCMSHLNPLLQFGLESFCSAAGQAGVDGLVVPDLPLEELAELARCASRTGLGICTMVAPTTPDSRIELAAARASGFLYCVSRTGVTGAGGSGEGPELLRRARARTEVPLALGFGVRERAQIDALTGLAEAVVVGTRFVEAAAAEDPVSAVLELGVSLSG